MTPPFPTPPPPTHTQEATILCQAQDRKAWTTRRGQSPLPGNNNFLCKYNFPPGPCNNLFTKIVNSSQIVVYNFFLSVCHCLFPPPPRSQPQPLPPLLTRPPTRHLRRQHGTSGPQICTKRAGFALCAHIDQLHLLPPPVSDYVRVIIFTSISIYIYI